MPNKNDLEIIIKKIIKDDKNSKDDSKNKKRKKDQNINIDEIISSWETYIDDKNRGK